MCVFGSRVVDSVFLSAVDVWNSAMREITKMFKKNFNPITQSMNVSYNNVKMYVMTIYCLMHTKQLKAAILRQWNNERAGF